MELANIVVEQPPKVEMGEYALPFSFELAKKLRKPPRKIAEEIAAAMPRLDGFGAWEVAGAGYINAKLDRAAVARQVAKGSEEKLPLEHPGKVLVEHTSINPNKAAHIGHLRNSVLGDTFVRLLRAAGREVDVQNYIDNTGVQVADVVVGFVEIEKKSKAEIEQMIASNVRFDYNCWDLYSKVSQWYDEPGKQEERKKVRMDVLHAIEKGGNELAEIAEVISTAVLKRHLQTMDRLGIEYDFLPRESEILHLHFWAVAFEQLKDKGVLYYETEGKNKGCWVMTRPGVVKGEESSGPDEDAKVIVRSNGTVGYVGKDIAYHMWKFGVLGKDFGYRKFYKYPNGKDVWISTDPQNEETGHPHFGDVTEVYNVIDARQSEPQETVKQAIRLLGYTDQADHYTHFSYEMVALTPRCAMELGYELSEEEKAKSYIEIKGRKGFGVKADDLLDRLVMAERDPVREKNPQLSEDAIDSIAKMAAVGALRYFMLKYTRPTVIAFDMEDALNPQGDTGIYLLYTAVRAGNIFNKGGFDADAVLSEEFEDAPYFAGETGDEFWQLWLLASQTSNAIHESIAQSEPAYVAKFAFQLSQQFNNFYHHHNILKEANVGKQKFLLRTAAVVRRELIRVLDVLGIAVPPVM